LSKGAIRDGDGYTPRFRAEVKSVYLDQHGNVSAVIRDLKRRGYRNPPDRKTIAKWVMSEQWSKDLAERDRVETAGLDPEDGPLDRLYKEAEAVRVVARNQLFEKSENGRLVPKSSVNPQDVYAYTNALKGCVEVLKSMMAEKRAERAAAPVDVIFEALMRHVKIGRILSDAAQRRKIRDLIADVMVEKQREEVGL